MIVNEKLKVLRKLMNEKNIQAYIIVTDDFHSSEYVGAILRCVNICPASPAQQEHSLF